MKTETYQQAIDYLFSQRAKGMKLGLDNIRNLTERLKHPEHRFPSIHIAGTNGKGSTVAILESILREAGYKSGRFISPHLKDMRERIQIRGRSITKKQVVESLQRMKPHIEATGASFFEILTAMAFLHFSENKVEIAVLETGLGGRLDATNVVTPLLTMITEIGLEHTRILGKRLESIALEKAGIFKPEIPCISGATHWRAKKALLELAIKRNVPLYFLKELVRLSNLHLSEQMSQFDCDTGSSNYHDLTLRLIGKHQIHNAALALLAVEELRKQGWNIPEQAIRNGLKKVQWRARLELLQENPKILLDSAHNPMSIQSLVKTLNSIFKYEKLILVFGVLKDKDYQKMFKEIGSLADSIVLTKPLNDRALDPEFLEHHPVTQGKPIDVIPDIQNAWTRALALANKDDLICAAGSIYLVGEVLRFWEESEKERHRSED